MSVDKVVCDSCLENYNIYYDIDVIDERTGKSVTVRVKKVIPTDQEYVRSTVQTYHHHTITKIVCKDCDKVLWSR